MQEIDWFNVGRDLTHAPSAEGVLTPQDAAWVETLLAQHPVDHVGGPDRVADFPAIPASAVEPMTDIVVGLVAEMVQCYIDAGSEREVTLEDETLREGIRQHFAVWVVPADIRAGFEVLRGGA